MKNGEHVCILEQLHQSHLGIAKTKVFARSYVWWPQLDVQIETQTKACITCQATTSNAPMAALLHPWTWPAMPWQHINLDFAGPYEGHMFLIVLDPHSRWPEVIQMKSTTAIVTIQELRCSFTSYGLPLQVVSDNGPQLYPQGFKPFMRSNSGSPKAH